jgi:hypothetical protein
LFDVTFDGNGGTIDGSTTAEALDVPENSLVMDVYDDFPNPLFDGHTWISP